MSSQNDNSRRTITAPVIQHHGPGLGKFLIVGSLSTIINGTIVGVALLLGLFLNLGHAKAPPPVNISKETEVEDPPKEFDLTTTDVGFDDSVPLAYNVDRIEDISVPGRVDPTQPVGIPGAPESAPMNVPPPPGAGGGTGGAPIDPNISGTGQAFGNIGGMGGPGVAGGFGGRSAATRFKMLQEGGGTNASEAAVGRGLRWLALHQASDGHWSLNNFPRHARTLPLPNGKVIGDKTTTMTTRSNDTAGTAFGLLPFLAAGITHKATGTWQGHLREDMTVGGQAFKSGSIVEILSDSADSTEFKCRFKLANKSNVDLTLTEKQVLSKPNYGRGVGAALKWLVAKQSKSGNDKGYYGGDMYSHGLATIAMCEAYGLSSDPTLKASAQLGIDYIVRAQDPAGGGWRYAPRQAGDTSVVGWQLMALKSGQMSGLSVPKTTLKNVEKFLNSAETGQGSQAGGYAYVPGGGATPAMTAVGGLCRQYLGVNPRNPSLLGTVAKIKQTPPAATTNLYYLYYATQVMHHMGGETWAFWNLGPDGTGKGGIRDTLMARQAKDGSFPGDDHVGGRLGATSLSLLSLEVYYRHLPLYRRDAGMKPDDK